MASETSTTRGCSAVEGVLIPFTPAYEFLPLVVQSETKSISVYFLHDNSVDTILDPEVLRDLDVPEVLNCVDLVVNGVRTTVRRGGESCISVLQAGAIGIYTLY